MDTPFLIVTTKGVKMIDILYCGDTSSKAAAAYLLGVLSKSGFSFQYINSDEKFINAKKAPAKLLILSDYPAKNISEEQRKKIFTWVKEGMSFWMIGGWESFYGLNGEYTKNWSKLLPVITKKADDRVNSYLPYVLNPLVPNHAILKNLPWEQAPSIGGFNVVKVKKESEVLMTAIPLKLSNNKGKISLKQGKATPMLVSSKFGKGKTLALMTDLAPHWCGGFVDWGNQRVKAQAKNANDVEVGHLYAKFITQSLKWLVG